MLFFKKSKITKIPIWNLYAETSWLDLDKHEFTVFFQWYLILKIIIKINI